MIKTSKLMKRVWIVTVSVIAITLMSVAVSFATEAQETAVDNPTTQDQTAVAEEIAAADEAVLDEVAASLDEDAATPLHVKFKATGDTSVALFCNHYCVIDGVKQPEEFFQVDLNEGITFTNPNIKSEKIVNCSIHSSGIQISAQLKGDDANPTQNVESFSIVCQRVPENIDVYFSGTSFFGGLEVPFKIGRYTKFIVNATVNNTVKNELVPKYEVPFYSADGTLVDIFTSDDKGKITMELNKEQASGYFYKYDAANNLSLFTLITDYSDSVDESTAVTQAFINLAEPDTFITGNDHHLNFIYNISMDVNDFKFADYKFTLKDFIGFHEHMLPIGPRANNINADLSLEMDVDNDGTLLFDGSKIAGEPVEVSLQPVAEAGYAFNDWNVMGKTYGPNSRLVIDTSDFKEGDVVDMQVNYKLVDAGEGTEIAQTSDATPLAAGVVAAFAVIAGLSLLALRKQH